MTPKVRSRSWAALSRPCPGEWLNGDAWIAHALGDARAFAVIDGLGHGAGANAAARAALDSLRGCIDPDPVALVERMHRDLRGTRGVSVTLCVFDGLRLRGCGVGNCLVRSSNPALSPLLGRGIVGGRVGPLRAFEAHLASGDRLVIHSDGVSPREWPDEVWTRAPAEAAALLVERRRRPGDDATALVVDVDDEGPVITHDEASE